MNPKRKIDKEAKAKKEQDDFIAAQVAATVGALQEVTIDYLVATMIRAIKTRQIDNGQMMDIYDAIGAVLDSTVEMAPLVRDVQMIQIAA